MSAAGGGKSADAFRTIREVSELVGVPPHILRFWETRFPQLKPIQRGGNRRYYRPADVALAQALHRLLHQDGYTVKGVQKLIAGGGLAAVVEGGAPAVPESPLPESPLPAAALPGGEAALLAALLAVRERLAVALAA